MTLANDNRMKYKRIVLYARELTPKKREILQHLSYFYIKQNTEVLILTNTYDFILQSTIRCDVAYHYLNPKTKRALQIQFIISDLQTFAPDALIIIDKIDFNVFLFFLFIRTDFLYVKNQIGFQNNFNRKSYHFVKRWLRVADFDFGFWTRLFLSINRDKHPNKILISLATYQFINQNKQELLQKNTPPLMVYHMDKQLITDDKIIKQGFNLQQMLEQACCMLVSTNDETYCTLAAEALFHGIPVFKVDKDVVFLEGALPEVHPIASLESAIKTYKITEIQNVLFNSIKASLKFYV